MCEYCEGKTLTDKVYEDGTCFDDYRSTRIETKGVPLLVSEVKRAAFHNYYNLTEEVYNGLTQQLSVPINFCPMCGRKLK